MAFPVSLEQEPQTRKETAIFLFLSRSLPIPYEILFGTNDIKRSWFCDKNIENIDIVQKGFCYFDM